MHEGLFPTSSCEVGSSQGALRRCLLLYCLCRGVDEGLDVLPLLWSAFPCFGLPWPRDEGTISANVYELTAGVTFSIFLSDLGVVDFSAIIQVVVG